MYSLLWALKNAMTTGNGKFAPKETLIFGPPKYKNFRWIWCVLDVCLYFIILITWSHLITCPYLIYILTSPQVCNFRHSQRSELLPISHTTVFHIILFNKKRISPPFLVPKLHSPIMCLKSPGFLERILKNPVILYPVTKWSHLCFGNQCSPSTCTTLTFCHCMFCHELS